MKRAVQIPDLIAPVVVCGIALVATYFAPGWAKLLPALVVATSVGAVARWWYMKHRKVASMTPLAAGALLDYPEALAPTRVAGLASALEATVSFWSERFGNEAVIRHAFDGVVVKLVNPPLMDGRGNRVAGYTAGKLIVVEGDKPWELVCQVLRHEASHIAMATVGIYNDHDAHETMRAEGFGIVTGAAN